MQYKFVKLLRFNNIYIYYNYIYLDYFNCRYVKIFLNGYVIHNIRIYFYPSKHNKYTSSYLYRMLLKFTNIVMCI